MSIRQDPQETLPAPPTGVALVTAEHEYNPENGHYEPSIRDIPRTADLQAPLAVAVFGPPIVANTTIWYYHFVFAETSGAPEMITLTNPAGDTYIVNLAANQTLVITSTPDAPLFMSRIVGAVVNTMIVGSTGAGTMVTAAYVVK